MRTARRRPRAGSPPARSSRKSSSSRELLIRRLSETVAILPPRQSIAAVLRLNRVLDRGLAHAVVGYTDALVETLLNRRGRADRGDPSPPRTRSCSGSTHLEEELAQLRPKNQVAPAVSPRSPLRRRR